MSRSASAELIARVANEVAAAAASAAAADELEADKVDDCSAIVLAAAAVGVGTVTTPPIQESGSKFEKNQNITKKTQKTTNK